jgi:hypothetical protein
MNFPKNKYSTFNQVLEDLNTEFNSIIFVVNNISYLIIKLMDNWYDENHKKTSTWKDNTFMVCKTPIVDFNKNGMPHHDLDSAENKVYSSWIELFEKYKIDGKPLKEVIAEPNTYIDWMER